MLGYWPTWKNFAPWWGKSGGQPAPRYKEMLRGSVRILHCFSAQVATPSKLLQGQQPRRRISPR